MRQWKKALAREVAEESSSHQWQNTGDNSQRGFIELARGCSWLMAAEVCLPLLHLRRTVSSVLKFFLFSRRAKRTPCTAPASRAGHLWWVCRWPAVSWNSGRKEKMDVMWLQIFCMVFHRCLSWLHGSCVALRAHWHLLPQRCVAKRMCCLKLAHSPMLEWHNANSSSKFELFRDGNPAPTAVKENCVLNCSWNWADPMGSCPAQLPVSHRGSEGPILQPGFTTMS